MNTPKKNDLCKQNYDGREVNCIVTNVNENTFDIEVIGTCTKMSNIPFEKFKKDVVKMFEEASRPLIKFINENYHPHVTAIVTPTSCELLSGEISIPEIFDYVVD